MSQELTTPTIAEMSEEMATYMGIQIQIIKTTKYPEGFTFYYEEDYLGYTETKYHTSWDCIHEVWEKVSVEEVDGMNEYWYQIELAICGNDIQEAFWALHRAITFINQLKQENNGKESI